MGQAWAYEGVFNGRNPRQNNRESFATALAYSQKAVKLDPTSSEAYSSLGHSLLCNHRWNEAEKALRRAIELDPNNVYASGYLSIMLLQKGRTEEAVRISRELAFADPVAIDIRRFYCIALTQSRKYDEAIVECERLIKLDPNHLTTYQPYASALVEKGRFQEAESAFDHSHLGIDAGIHAWLLARQGKTAEARQVLADNASLVNPRTAVAHYLLGEQERGLRELDYLANEMWIEKTYFLRVDPMFDPMRSDPRFTAIVKKTGLLDK